MHISVFMCVFKFILHFEYGCSQRLLVRMLALYTYLSIITSSKRACPPDEI